MTNNVDNSNHNDGLDQNGGGDTTVVTLSGNKAYFNTKLGISQAPGGTDGGNNKADGNGNPAQCANVVCS